MAMRITTWNINGLRSAVRGDFAEWLRTSRDDVVCLQEVKVEDDLLTPYWFPGYRAHFAPARRRGYAGVATLVRESAASIGIETGIGHALDDEGRVVTIYFSQFSVVNVYAPHSHRKLLRLDSKLAFLDALTSFILRKRGEGRRLILAGDFNVAHQDVDLSNPRANAKNAGFLEPERKWVSDLISCGYVDAFRAFDAAGGHYTWWSLLHDARPRNIGWRLDYIFVASELAPALAACWHQTERTGSDHCAVTAELNIEI